MLVSSPSSPAALFEYSRKLKPPALPDYAFTLAAAVLLCFGLVMVYSTTGVIAQERFGDSLFFAKRQVAAAFIGVLLAVALARVPIKFFMRIASWCYFFTLLLLAAPMIPGLGDDAGGATRWVAFAGVRFQPGEIAKLTFVIFLAGYLTRHEKELSSVRQGIVMPFLLLAPAALLFLLKPDFGSAVVLVLVAISMAACAGARLLYLCGAGALLSIAAVALVVTSPYRMSRVMSFLYPWQDAQGKGYQLIQSLIAVGSGELSGVGIGASQQKLFFLPAAHTDFIFAVIAEEMGFVGAVFVVALFAVLLWRGLVIATRLAGDTFCFALAIGVTLLLVMPAFLNIGVVTGLLPTKGMVLPLVAYGGSSLIASLAAVGILLALGRHFQHSVR